MCLFIYALEKLRPGRCNDYIGSFTSAFTNSKIVLGGHVYWNWDGINSLKCTVPATSAAAGTHNKNQKLKIKMQNWGIAARKSYRVGLALSNVKVGWGSPHHNLIRGPRSTLP